MEEIWVPVKGYNGRYEVSNLGRVKNSKRGNVLNPTAKSNKYRKVTFYDSGKPNYVCVHRVVVESFLRDIKRDEVVNHIDGDKLNNNLCNLEIVTCRENNTHGIMKSGRGLTGAVFDKRSKKWRPTIRINGKMIQLGSFDTPEDAHNAYMAALEKSGLQNKYAGRIRNDSRVELSR